LYRKIPIDVQYRY